MSGNDDYRRPIRDPEILERMAITFDLFDTAVAMVRQNALRRNPEATEAELEEAVRAWLQDRPDIESDESGFRPSNRFS